MRLARTAAILGLTVLTGISGPLAAADAPHVYGGLMLGRSKATVDNASITRGLLGPGFAPISILEDDRDDGYKVVGGYRFNSRFALEAGYFDLGKTSFAATTVPAGTLNGNTRIKGLSIDAVGFLPLTDYVSAFARVGVNFADVRGDFSGTGAVTVLDPTPRKRDAGYKVGVGVQVEISDSLGLRAEAERYGIKDVIGNKGHVDFFSLGLLYRFGGKLAAVAEREAPSGFVAAAPAPPPAVVTPPPPPPKPAVTAQPSPPPPQAPTKVTLSADILFDFDKAIVTPAGKQVLDKFAADLRGAAYEIITSTGHTDRLGRSEYNQKLSQRRAEAVKAYLVQAGGIPAGRITARGAGETEPVTKPGQCTRMTRKQLIACLQPDRRDRVVVEVSATR